MKFNLTNLGLFTAACSLMFTACKHSSSSSSSGDFDTDQATGVLYKFIKHNESGKKPAIGDFATVIMEYRNDKDSMIWSSKMARKRPGDTTQGITFPLNKGFNGCLEQGITLMSIGDSAQFKVNSDTLYLKQFHAPKLPAGIHAGTYLTFYVRLLGIKSKEQMQQEQQQQMAKMQAQMQVQKQQETADIAKYISDNHIKATPSKDSLFFLERSGGKGKAIKDGDSLAVNYVGTLLNGTEFDASAKHGGPYKLQYKPDMQVIAGWREALGTMHEGEKAKILLPSSLGYGSRGMGGAIPPYSPLIFTMEVVKVYK